uniref:Uncharacterized protein n=1 Tax=Avena sativa TaxID=4498 RepID=A0ACD5XUF6_AVESA
MIQWHELLVVARSINFSDQEDQLIWQYESKVVYSSSSMYSIINFRGVKKIFLPAVWKLKIPPRVQIFLWLLSQNKIMTRDNLRARGIPKPLECEFCKEVEFVHHLMFDCIIARSLWSDVFKIFHIQVSDYESVACKWLCNKKFLHFNIVTSAMLWGLWNVRNCLVFNRSSWINMKQVWNLVFSYLRNWKVAFQEIGEGESARFITRLLQKLKRPLRLPPC